MKRLGYETELIESYHQRSGGNADSNIEPAKLVTAKYFFWNSGSKLQKSQEGLLRSLIFEVLRQCPELVGHVLKTRSERRGFSANSGDSGNHGPFVATESWSFEELLLTLRDIISVRMSATFCLFIDGLDEYQEANKRTYRDLIDTLNQIAKFPNAKVCASSRPWTVFLDAFKSISAYSLKLEDLTRGDIRRFVSDKFEQHDQYGQLKAHDTGYEALVEEVVNRAQGVFLWVFLVVKDLLEGLTYNDSVQTMRKRLNQFPEDLEDFFQHMIESIPPLYRRQAARTFFITMSAPEPLLLTLHAFLDYIEDDPEFFLRKTQKIEETELLRMHERMRRQLEGRTKGLLEVVSISATEPLYNRFSVYFLHRTVKDFLRSSSKVQYFMTSGQKELSETWVLLCRGTLSVIKHAPLPSQPTHEYRSLAEFVFFADKALGDPNNESIIIALFKELESDVDVVARTYLHTLLCEYGILSLMQLMKYDWTAALDPHPQTWPLLSAALIGFRGSAPQQQDVVTYLLEKGADPDQKFDGVLPFQQYMKKLYEARHTEEEDRHSFQIVAALVAHGADLSILVARADNSQITALDVIWKVFSPERASMILEGSPTWKGAQEELLRPAGKSPDSSSPGKSRDGLPPGKRGQGQEQEEPSTSGGNTCAVSRRAAARSWFKQRLGWKSR